MISRWNFGKTPFLLCLLLGGLLFITSAALSENIGPIRAGEYVHISKHGMFMFVGEDDYFNDPDNPLNDIADEILCMADCGPVPFLMERVLVLRTNGNQALIEYQSDVGPIQRWYPVSSLVPSQAFRPMTEWRKSEEFVLCDEAEGCFRVMIDENANYQWERIAYFKTENRPLVNCGQRCSYSGQLESFEKYIRMKVGSTYEIFVAQEHQGLCWAKSLDMYGTCLPSYGLFWGG